MGIVMRAQGATTKAFPVRTVEEEQRSDRAQDPCALRVASGPARVRVLPARPVLTRPAPRLAPPRPPPSPPDRAPPHLSPERPHLARTLLPTRLHDRSLKVKRGPPPDGCRAKDTTERGARERRRPQSFLYGAIFAAVAKMTQRPEKRRVLILFRDAVASETAAKAKA